MCFKTLAIFLAATYIILHTIVSGNPSGCENPLGKKGMCIPLVKCTSLADGLRKQPTSDANLFFLQKSLCGVDSVTLQSMVCCAETLSAGLESGGSVATSASVIYSPENKQSDFATLQNDNHSTGDVQLVMTMTTATTTTTLEVPNTFSDEIRYHSNIHLLPSTRLCGYNTASSRIVGGSEAGLGTYPWMALIAYKVSRGPVQYGCGGTLISPRYILTAAHCFANLPKDPLFTPVNVVLGEYDKRKAIDCDDQGVCAPPPQTIPIQEIVSHEEYNKDSRIENDIALIRLAKEVVLGPFVAPICLPVDENIFTSMLLKSNLMRVAGWGRTKWDNEENSDVLQDILVPLVPDDKCLQVFQDALHFQLLGPGRFCAGGVKDQDSCHGDSGGPIMQTLNVPAIRNQTRTFQFGIVSMGPGSKCGEENKPSLYTRVTYYMKWILDHLRP